VNKGLHPPTPLERRGPVRFPPPLIAGLVTGLAGWIHWMGWAAVWPDPTPASIGAGAAVAILGLVLVTWAGTSFAKAATPLEPWKPAKALVEDGPYRFTRNPIYLAFLLLQVGIALAMGWWLALATLPLTLVLLDVLVVRKEEAHLARFPEYDEYRRRVRRWL
jgi:protein-S-isoprenylcysteine O-methyltransferase Ste14